MNTGWIKDFRDLYEGANSGTRTIDSQISFISKVEKKAYQRGHVEGYAIGLDDGTNELKE